MVLRRRTAPAGQPVALENCGGQRGLMKAMDVSTFLPVIGNHNPEAVQEDRAATRETKLTTEEIQLISREDPFRKMIHLVKRDRDHHIDHLQDRSQELKYRLALKQEELSNLYNTFTALEQELISNHVKIEFNHMLDHCLIERLGIGKPDDASVETLPGKQIRLEESKAIVLEIVQSMETRIALMKEMVPMETLNEPISMLESAAYKICEPDDIHLSECLEELMLEKCKLVMSLQGLEWKFMKIEEEARALAEN